MSEGSFVTPFAQRFELRVPVVQAPMAGGATTPAMVAAVSNAGGLGFLAGAALLAGKDRERSRGDSRADRSSIRRESVRARTGRAGRRDRAYARSKRSIRLRADLGLPPGSPLARYAPDFRAQLDMLIELRVPLASFTFGLLPADDVARLHANGLYVIGTATHVAEGVAWRDAGADAIAAQGAEAGAHRGTFIGAFEDALIGTMALVPQLVDATGLPVLAAGGIMDGRGIVAALALGAQAAVMGTAFLTCHESAIPQAWKTRVRAMSDTSTSVTRAITGRHARGIRNPLMRRLSETMDKIAPYPVQNALTQELRQTASRAQNGDYLSLWSGQGAPLGRARREGLGAAELMAPTRTRMA